MKYYPSKDIFLNIKKNKFKLQTLKKYLIDSNYKKFIFSKKGIYLFEDNLGLIRLNFEDRKLETLKLNNYKLLCDSSQVNRDNDIVHQLPIDYILKIYKINRYKLSNNSQIELYLEFDELDNLLDVWFETKENVGEHAISDIVTLLDEVN